VLVTRNATILASTLPDGNTALLNTDTGRYLTFDASATAIWQRTENPITFDDLIASLMEEFEVERAVLEADVRAALETLAEKKVIQITDHANSDA
jgi:hypothetical protein